MTKISRTKLSVMAMCLSLLFSVLLGAAAISAANTASQVQSHEVYSVH